MQIKKLSAIFAQKVNAVTVVEIGVDLKLLNVEIRPEVKVTALKIVELAADKRNEIILAALRSFLQENNILHRNAILKPSLNVIFTKRLQLPAMPRAELRDAIKLKLKAEVPFDLNTAAFDFSVIKETAGEDGSKQIEIICIAACEQEIKEQVLLLKQAGLNCLSVNLLAFGYSNIITRYFTPGKNETTGILHIADDRCFITIHGDDKIEYYRELPLSIDKFKEALSGTLATDRGMVNLSPEDINSILFEHGIPVGGATSYKDKLAASRVLGMLRLTLERLASEIKRSLTYYDTQYQGGAKVNRIMIAGLGAGVPNLDKFLAQELNLDIQKINLEDKVKISGGVSPRDLSESAGGLGLALDYENSINLLPYEFRSEKIETFQKVSLRWIAFSAFLILAVSYIFAKASVGIEERRLKNTLLQLNVLSEVSNIKSKLDILNKFSGEINSLDAPVEPILKKISNIAAREIFFNQFNLDFTSKSGWITGVLKRGDETILTGFVSAFNQSGYVVDTAIDDIEKGEADTNNFKIIFKLP
jgi:type IV pilus assembly protein PilM